MSIQLETFIQDPESTERNLKAPMRLSRDVTLFGKVSELLLSELAVLREPTAEEKLLIEHYCKEVLDKITSPIPANKIFS